MSGPPARRSKPPPQVLLTWQGLDVAVPPGETLAEVIKDDPAKLPRVVGELGLANAEELGPLLAGTAELDQATAEALERATGIYARLWVAMEVSYRDALARGLPLWESLDDDQEPAG